MTFNEYRARHCKGTSRPLARKLYNMYLETEKVSTDMITTKLPMGGFMIQTDYHTSDFYNDCIQLAPTPQDCCKTASVPCAKAKGNNPMYVDNDKHIESSKINYLNQRIETATYAKRDALAKQFGLQNDAAPTTAQQLLDRIKAGKFVVDTDKLNKRLYCTTDVFQWRDPAVVKDEAGYDLAEKAMDEQTKNVYDLIAIDTPANALAAIKAFEAWTYTAPAAPSA